MDDRFSINQSEIVNFKVVLQHCNKNGWTIIYPSEYSKVLTTYYLSQFRKIDRHDTGLQECHFSLLCNYRLCLLNAGMINQFKISF